MFPASSTACCCRQVGFHPNTQPPKECGSDSNNNEPFACCVHSSVWLLHSTKALQGREMQFGANEQKAADASLTTQRRSQARPASLLWPRGLCSPAAGRSHAQQRAPSALGTRLVSPGFALHYDDGVLPKAPPPRSHAGFENEQEKPGLRDSPRRGWEPLVHRWAWVLWQSLASPSSSFQNAALSPSAPFG